MMRWSWLLLPAKLPCTFAGRLFRSLGYLKEVVGFAVVLGLISWLFATINREWTGESRRAAASPRITVSRAVENPWDGTWCVYRDFREVVVLDSRTHEELFRQKLRNIQRVELGADRSGWSFLALANGRDVQWRHSLFGMIELSTSDDAQQLVDVSLSRDGSTAVAVDRAGEVRHWRLREDGIARETRWTLPISPYYIELSSNGELLAVKSSGNRLHVFDAESGHQAAPAVPIDNQLLALGWAVEGERLATATESRVLSVWRMDQDVGLEWRASANFLPTALAVSSDGRQLIVGTSEGEIVCYREGVRSWSHRTHEACVRFVTFINDGRKLLTGSIQGQLAVQSLDTGEPIRRFDATMSH
jgi:WD40 repeat protein